MKRKRHFRLWDASVNLASYVPFRDPVTGRWWHWVPSYHEDCPLVFKRFVEGMGPLAKIGTGNQVAMEPASSLRSEAQ